MSACRSIAAFIVLFVAFSASNAEIKDYDKKCHVDKSRPAEEADNYKFCNTPEAIENNSTSCCAQDGEVQCCESSGTNTMLIIGFAIAGCTVGLATACIVIFWCEPHKLSCTRKYLTRCCANGPCNKATDEELQLTEMAHQVQRSDKSYVRERSEFAANSKEMPEECKGNPTGNWWDSSLTLRSEVPS